MRKIFQIPTQIKTWMLRFPIMQKIFRLCARIKIRILRFLDQFSAIDMTTGRPWHKLLLFALPLLVGNVFQQLYSTMDAIFLGRFVGDHALAAVGSTIAIFFLIMVLMMGISMGAGVMVAQYFGAKRREDLSYTIGNCITLTAILGGFLMVVGPFLTRPLLVFLDTPPEIIDYSVTYINVLMLGVLGMSYFNMLSGILRGVGDALSPLLYLVFSSLLSIGLNYLFVGVIGWGVMGAAVSTVMAQTLSALLCLRKLMQMRNLFEIKLSFLRPKRQYVNQVMKLGLPTGLSQAVFSIAMMVIQPLANSFGYLFLATNIIVMKVDGFVMMPNFSFGNAMTVYAGQNMGAGKVDRVSKGTKQCVYLALGTAVVMVGVILSFGHNIAGLFTQTEEVLYTAVRFLRILAVGYLAFSINMVLWGTIRGAGDAITPMYASLLNTALVRVPLAYLLVYLMGRPEALIYSLLISWVSISGMSVIAYKIGRWKTKGLVKDNIVQGDGGENDDNEEYIDE
ncbi:MAG: MATE family efflux transporter [Defluviitaleaceae bacterium]|nr:MATE family efflux transporter [Defluviitaleaceae bacterium]